MRGTRTWQACAAVKVTADGWLHGCRTARLTTLQNLVGRLRRRFCSGFGS